MFNLQEQDHTLASWFVAMTNILELEKKKNRAIERRIVEMLDLEEEKLSLRNVNRF